MAANKTRARKRTVADAVSECAGALGAASAALARMEPSVASVRSDSAVWNRLAGWYARRVATEGLPPGNAEIAHFLDVDPDTAAAVTADPRFLRALVAACSAWVASLLPKALRAVEKALDDPKQALRAAQLVISMMPKGAEPARTPAPPVVVETD